MSAGKFIAGFVVGGAIGAIAGILLAPKSGEETRAMLSNSAKDMIKKADETAKQIQSKADDAVSELQKKGEEIKGKLQDLINKQKNENENQPA
jgi:gas vesicle protein